MLESTPPSHDPSVAALDAPDATVEELTRAARFAVSLRRAAAALSSPLERSQVMEAIWVAAEMRAGGAYAHAAVAIQAMDEMPGR